MDNASTYIARHLEFVSNLAGTTVIETFLIIITQYSFFLLQILYTLLPSLLTSHSGLRFLPEFAILVLPQLLVMTILEKYGTFIGLVLSILCTIISILCVRKAKRLTPVSMHKLKEETQVASDSASVFRQGLLVMTAICILAVDFPLFPRRFAKTETYGYGIMDLGVGQFIIANAIVSREARGISDTPKNNNLHHAFVSSFPLLTLGFIRYAMLKVTGYHENVSEYGQHWNFFFTLAFTKILAGLTFKFSAVRHSFWIALSIISMYQYVLTCHQVSYYLLEDATIAFEGSIRYYLEANRSGIYSCVGYLSIYLFGVTLGRYLFRKQKLDILEWTLVGIRMYLVTGTLLIILFICHNFIEKVSRKLANLTYVIWVLSCSCFCLAFIIIANSGVAILRLPAGVTSLHRKSLQQSNKNVRLPSSSNDACLLNCSLLGSAISRKGLWYFVLANLGTGLINLSMDTINATDIVSLITLVLYMLFVSVVIIILEDWKYREILF